MKIIFMGSPDFALASLKKLVYENIKIELVVTNPDRPKGRSLKIIETPVKEFARKSGIDIITPESIQTDEAYNIIKDIAPDLIIVVAYGKIIPKRIIDIPKYGIINLHGSLLPKYRGAAPIQRAVLNGDKETGVTVMYIEEELDSGDMIAKRKINITEDDTTETVFNSLKEIGAELLYEVVTDFYKKKGRLSGEKQKAEDVTYADKISKEEAFIDFNKSSEEIKNLVRGMNGIMGSKLQFNSSDNIYKIFKVSDVNREEIDKFNLNEVTSNPGDYYQDKNNIIFKTGDGYLKILEIQAPNKKRMDIKSFLLGNSIE